LRLTGAYDEALSVIQQFESREPASVALSNVRARSSRDGAHRRGAEAFEKAVAGKAETC
jgi:hypothetical protein